MPDLPPEMQERINNIIADAQKNQAEQVVAPAPPPPRPPSVVDHIHAIRAENQQLMQAIQQQQQHLNAMSQAFDAVGQAVGYLYQRAVQADQQLAEQPQHEGESYSERFTQAQDDDF